MQIADPDQSAVQALYIYTNNLINIRDRINTRPTTYVIFASYVPHSMYEIDFCKSFWILVCSDNQRNLLSAYNLLLYSTINVNFEMLGLSQIVWPNTPQCKVNMFGRSV